MFLVVRRLWAVMRALTMLLRERRNPRFHVLLRQTFERLGVSFIKLGQTMSMRPDFLPIHLCREMEKCLDDMPSVPFEDIARLIRRELGKHPRQLFRSFEEKPVASASIAQVHRGVLHSGQRVAVKVMKPGVEQLMKADLRILRFFAAVADWLHLIPLIKLRPLIREYERFTKEELDFRNEANFTKIIAENEEVDIRCPRIYDEYSARRVLTLEWLDGTAVSQLIEMKRQGKLRSWLRQRNLSLQSLIQEILDTGLQQPLLGGFFHGDLHPSNILVADDGEIQWIDFGISGYLDDALRYHYFYFILSLAHDDAAGCVYFMEKCCGNGIRKGYNRTRYRTELNRIIDESKGKTAAEFSQGELIQRIIHTSAQAGLDVPNPLVLLVRSTLAMSGMVQKLYPTWVWTDHTRELFRRVFRSHMRRKFRRNKMLYETDRTLRMFSDMPELTLHALREKGRKEAVREPVGAMLDD